MKNPPRLDNTKLTSLRSKVTPLTELLKLLHLSVPESSALGQYEFHHRRIAAGQSLYRAGEAFENLYFLFSGALKLVLCNSDGNECVIEFPMKSDLIGMDGICEHRYQVDAVALMDVDVIVLPFRTLVSLTHEVPIIEYFLYNALSRGMVREQANKSLLTHLSAEARLARFMLMLSTRFEVMGCSSNCFLLRMTRQDVGNYLGMTIETVSRSLTALAATGLISVNQRTITLHDKPALRTLLRLPTSSRLRYPVVHDEFAVPVRKYDFVTHNFAAYEQ